MNCQRFQSQLDAWLDQELEESIVLQMGGHEAICTECSGLADERRGIDQFMRFQLEPSSNDLERLRTRIVRQLPWQSCDVARPSRWGRILGWLVAAAAGFLVASFILPHLRRPQLYTKNSTEPHVAGEQVAEITPTPHLPTVRPASRAGVGNSSDRSNAMISVNDTGESMSLRIVRGANVVAPDDFPCEIITTSRTVVRLDKGTEISAVAEDEMRLLRGRVWCCVADPAAQFTLHAPAISVVMRQATCDLELVNDQCRVTSAQGNVQVATPTTQRRALMSGEQLIYVDGGKETFTRVDPILTSSWIHPLLAMKSPANTELRERIRWLWARVQPTTSVPEPDRYEVELRALGVSCVAPLCEFLGSSDARSGNDPSTMDESRREQAANLLADLVDRPSSEPLIELLHDNNPVVRMHAARGLSRVSGEDFGMSPDDWQRLSVTECRIASETWRRWLRNPQISQPPIVKSFKKA